MSTVSMSKTVLLQTIQFSDSMKFLNIKNSFPFQVIQSGIIMHFSFIWAIDRILSSATTLSQSRPMSDGNEGVLCIPQSCHI